MFPAMLQSSNPLVKYPAAAAIIFLPLYVAMSMGFKTAWVLALVTFAYFMIKSSNQFSIW